MSPPSSVVRGASSPAVADQVSAAAASLNRWWIVPCLRLDRALPRGGPGAQRTTERRANPWAFFFRFSFCNGLNLEEGLSPIYLL